MIQLVIAINTFAFLMAVILAVDLMRHSRLHKAMMREWNMYTAQIDALRDNGDIGSARTVLRECRTRINAYAEERKSGAVLYPWSV